MPARSTPGQPERRHSYGKQESADRGADSRPASTKPSRKMPPPVAAVSLRRKPDDDRGVGMGLTLPETIQPSPATAHDRKKQRDDQAEASVEHRGDMFTMCDTVTWRT